MLEKEVDLPQSRPMENSLKAIISTSLAFVVCAMTVASAAASVPILTGRWQSAAPEVQGNLFVTRDFRFEKNTWRVIYRAYGDAEAKVALFTLDVGGVFVIGGPSASVAGAYEGVFPATHRKIVADSGAGVAMFAQMGCKLAVGAVKALVSEPCGFVPSQMQAMGEYDLVAIKGGQLFFGERSGDLTKERPKALYPFPLVRR